jgi:hypothetical protein
MRRRLAQSSAAFGNLRRSKRMRTRWRLVPAVAESAASRTRQRRPRSGVHPRRLLEKHELQQIILQLLRRAVGQGRSPGRNGRIRPVSGRIDGHPRRPSPQGLCVDLSSRTSPRRKRISRPGVVMCFRRASVNGLCGGGSPCVRTGPMTFAITQNRRYWRLQEPHMVSCDGSTDYVDIFF